MRLDGPFSDLAAIVVHHNSPGTLLHTLQALSDAGLPNGVILVVDNSDQAAAVEAAKSIAGSDFPLLHTTNRGYAAAVNDGLACLAKRGLSREFTVVATHESIAAPEALSVLRTAILADDRIAVVGPTLINAESDEERLWSAGGMLSRILKRPQHQRSGSSFNTNETVDREWLDGAFAMYRTSLLTSFGVDETYFLYFEETDLHTRLRRAGLRVAWVPLARVSQRSSGIPPQLLGRNLFLFQARHFSRTRGRVAVGYEVLRSIGRTALTSRGHWSDVKKILTGWIQGEAIVRTTDFARAVKSQASEPSVRNSDG